MTQHVLDVRKAHWLACGALVRAAAFGVVILILNVSRAAAANWNVSSTADNNALGTLRFAVNNAAAQDTINFAAALAGQTINLTGGELAIGKSMTIIGPGPTNLAIVNVNGRVFHVMNGPVSVSISGLQLTGRLIGADGSDGTFIAPDGLPGADATGGCIQNDPQCTLTVSNCFFTGCEARAGNGGNGYTNDTYGFLSNGGQGGECCGGAICNNMGDLLLYRCTFSSNSSAGGRGGNGYYGGAGGAGGVGQGGALCDVYGNQDILIVNCTFYTNSASGGFGGNAGDAWKYHVGPANGGPGGPGGEADGGAIFIGQGCPMPDCTGLVHDTIDDNVISPGGGKPGGAGVNGGNQGARGANGAANGGGL
ncbi:MAG TPA: hypothetical protein VN281_09855, partial [Verrucomicrobiae bacterium]|nr:hypothetical protein [Verrucomicrobiae bacterium]